MGNNKRDCSECRKHPVNKLIKQIADKSRFETDNGKCIKRDVDVMELKVEREESQLLYLMDRVTDSVLYDRSYLKGI